MKRWPVFIFVVLVLSSQLCAQTTKKQRSPKLPPPPAGVTIQSDIDFLEPGRAEKLDLYFPTDRAKDVRSPAVVIIHGGGWVGGDKAVSREFEIGTTLAKAGYVCASVNYTLERGNWPKNLFDCKNAVRFLRKNSESYQVDVKHIGVVGGSAGGHLALMVAYTTDVPELEPPAPYPGISSAVNCVIDMYGITNLLTRSKTDEKGNAIGTPGDKAAAMLTEPRDDHEELWKSASPVTYVSKKTVPTLILHGMVDTTVNREQATELAAKLKEFGVEHEIHMVPGVGHTFDFETWNRKPLPKDLRPTALAFFDKYLKPSASTTKAAAASIQWDQDTLRYLGTGGYPRMIRLNDGSALLSCEDGGRAIVRRSDDAGRSWSEPVEAARSENASASNPQPLQLKSGAILLFFNERPRDHQSDYAIGLTISHDGGQSWKLRAEPLYRADKKFANGCWEPAAVQLSSGEILLFFANESPYRSSDEQEITVMKSRDDGATWSEPKCFSLRKGGRDGMPVPMVLKNGKLVVAVEDTGGRASNELQPAILQYDPANDAVITGDDARRSPAVALLDADAYAGAPFLAHLPDGTSLLSCQANTGEQTRPQMTVFVGDNLATHFERPSRPYQRPGKWNSLYVRDDDTIVALTSANIESKAGIWAIDGRLVRPGVSDSR